MHYCRKKTGFTLIELLVVISIIALLLSIIMPALGKVKQQAGRVVCLTNIKQLTLTGLMYAQDNKDKLFWRQYTYGPNYYYRPAEPVEYNDHRWFWEQYLSGFDLNSEIGSKLLYCPSNKLPMPAISGAPAGEWNGFTHYDYYNMGSFATTPGWNAVWNSRNPMPIKTTNASGYTPLFGDLMMSRDDSYGEYWRLANHFRSGARVYEFNEEPLGANTGFLDGSGEWRRYPEDMGVALEVRSFGTFFWWGRSDPQRNLQRNSMMNR